MKLRPIQGLAAIAVVSALVLAGCSTDSKTTSSEASPSSSSTPDTSQATTAPADAKLLEGITFKAGELNTAPSEYSVTADLTKLTGPAVRITSEGSGDVIPENSIAEMQMVAVGLDGKQIDSTYDGGSPQLVPISSATIPQLVDALKGQKVGVRAVFGAPGTPASGDTKATDPQIIVIEVVGVHTTEVVPNSDALPQVTRDAKGVPSIKIPEGFKAGKNIQVVVLEEGDGDVLTPDDTIKANYTGWNLKGKAFDTSFDKDPVTFPLSQVIPGWTYGLTGQKIGSKLLLIIPADFGYGPAKDGDAEDAATGDLLFVVDVEAQG